MGLSRIPTVRTLNTAYSHGSRPEHFSKFLDVEEDGSGVNIDISTVPDQPVNGEPLTVNVTVTNLSDSDVTANINSVLKSCLYTGVKKHFVAKDQYKDRDIAANSGKLENVYRIIVSFFWKQN